MATAAADSKLLMRIKKQLSIVGRCSKCGKKLKSFDSISENPLTCWQCIIVKIQIPDIHKIQWMILSFQSFSHNKRRFKENSNRKKMLPANAITSFVYAYTILNSTGGETSYINCSSICKIIIVLSPVAALSRSLSFYFFLSKNHQNSIAPNNHHIWWKTVASHIF